MLEGAVVVLEFMLHAPILPMMACLVDLEVEVEPVLQPLLLGTL